MCLDQTRGPAVTSVLLSNTDGWMNSRSVRHHELHLDLSYTSAVSLVFLTGCADEQHCVHMLPSGGSSVNYRSTGQMRLLQDYYDRDVIMSC